MSAPFNESAVAIRRAFFMGSSIFLTATGLVLLLRSYAGQHIFWPDYIVIGLFPLLFGQIAIGFMLAFFGLFDRLRGGDPLHVMHRPWREKEESVPLAATAIVIPVYNEEVQRVSQAIANMWHSLEKTGQIEHFDFYLCSDSNDPNRWVEEECAWIYLCQKLKAFGKIFYRKRRHSINAKSGNIADFCRRWGKRYRYMIVLDADSVMSGPTMVRLVRAMEANSEVGIIQTQPCMVLGQSLFRRVLQFSGRIYGGIFSQGCSMAQTSSGSYWGHNAIIRIAPFIEYCDLPFLPVPNPRHRHVLSHDTVEAALMQRAGYDVWVAYEEEGTYEEGPPNLGDMLTRDRRWCAGNLQHFWFLFARRIEMGNRLQIWIGLMAYLCSPIWLAFLLAGSFASYNRMRFLALSAGPEDLGAPETSESLILFFLTLTLLFVPRLLGLLTTLPRMRQFGGFLRLIISAFMETIISILIAPVLMLFHTLFVLQAVSGWQIKWATQNRADTSLSFPYCLMLFGWQSCLGLLSCLTAFYYLGTHAYWLVPIFTGWFLAPMTAWITSSGSLGKFFRACGLFIIPEEFHPPEELKNLNQEASNLPSQPLTPTWAYALLCPYVQALHLSMGRQRSYNQNEKPAPSLVDLREQLLREGPVALGTKDKMRLLWDPETVFWLHQELWSRPEAHLHADWIQFQNNVGGNDSLSPLFHDWIKAP